VETQLKGEKKCDWMASNYLINPPGKDLSVEGVPLHLGQKKRGGFMPNPNYMVLFQGLRRVAYYKEMRGTLLGP